jgi:transposase-like protein
MTTKKPRPQYSPELRERAVRMVLEHRSDHPTLWATIEAIAPKIGCATQTLHEWVKKAETNAGVRPGLTSDERARMKAMEREIKELRQANEILRKASAFFAQAELDRKPKS